MQQGDEEVYYLYLISSDEPGDYDTFDSAIVSAKDEKSACMIHPSLGFMTDEQWILHKTSHKGRKHIKNDKRDYDGWVNDYTLVKSKLIGLSYEKDTCVILASFNAG